MDGFPLEIPLRRERVQGDGLRLHVTVAGHGPPVMLLHGFPENASSWRKQIAPLVSAGFSVWMPNLRGYPPSDVSPRRGDYHLRYLAADVAALVAFTGYPRAHIVGHDWGGIIAWTFAGMYPGLVDKLVIMNAPHMRIFVDKVWHTSQLLRSLYAGFFQLPLVPELTLSAHQFLAVRNIFSYLPAREGTFGGRDIDNYVATLSQPGALKAALDFYRENFTSDGLALACNARTDAEVLVIWGERDPALGRFLLEGVERFAPRVRVHRIADAGHWIQNEAPEEVNQALLDFLGNAHDQNDEEKGGMRNIPQRKAGDSRNAPSIHEPRNAY